jgi:DNA-binding GntR family transcriptional regulator
MSTVLDVREQGLARPALAVELAERLRQMIVEGELTPEQKVPERVLTARFGVSRTPLREALKVLASEGYVRLVPNRGAVVRGLTLAEIEAAFPIIAALEATAGELACTAASAAEIAAIRRRHERMRQAFAAADRPRYFALNQAIHQALIAAAHNPILAQHHAMVAGRCLRARYLANLSARRWQAAMAEHERIIALLEDRDGPALAALLKAHIEGKLAALREAMADPARAG